MYNSQLITNSNNIMNLDETTQLRENFANSYCSQKGWNKYNLTFEQITEIRSHKEWKNPHMIVS